MLVPRSRQRSNRHFSSGGWFRLETEVHSHPLLSSSTIGNFSFRELCFFFEEPWLPVDEQVRWWVLMSAAPPWWDYNPSAGLRGTGSWPAAVGRATAILSHPRYTGQLARWHTGYTLLPSTKSPNPLSSIATEAFSATKTMGTAAVWYWQHGRWMNIWLQESHRPLLVKLPSVECV